MKKRDKTTGKVKNLNPVDDWREKFFKDNGSVQDQIIEQAESPTVYKNKIKNWIAENPKPIN